MPPAPPSCRGRPRFGRTMILFGGSIPALVFSTLAGGSAQAADDMLSVNPTIATQASEAMGVAQPQGVAVPPAAAQRQDDDRPFLLAQASGGTVTAQPQALVTPPVAPDDEYSQYERLRVKGYVINVAAPADTVDRQAFGIRRALADQGIGYLIYTNSNFTDNVLEHQHPLNNERANQVYAGQLPTYLTAAIVLVTYDLSRFGIPDGQIVVGGDFQTVNWEAFGPRTASLATASYYQTLFHKAVEIKIGWFPNTIEFLGTQVGGNLASGVFGFSATLLGEQGQNNYAAETPGLNIKLNLPDHFYDKFGVQRALSPDGIVVEHQANPSAARFVIPNAGTLVMNEAGYRVAASPGVPQTWIRAAASWTNSNYRDLDRPDQRGGPSYGLFLLADRQLLQTSSQLKTAAQGLYAGFSVEYVPPQFNRFSRYYEGRIYGVGLLPHRPLDLMSFVYNRNAYSALAVDQALAAGEMAHSATNTYSLAYSAHLFHGFNLNLGLSYIDHPTPVVYNATTGHALSTYLGAVVFF